LQHAATGLARPWDWKGQSNMVVIVKSTAAAEDINCGVARIESLGMQAHIARGKAWSAGWETVMIEALAEIIGSRAWACLGEAPAWK